MQITIGDYVIRPYQNGLCWTIDKMAEVKKRDGTLTKEMVSTKRFPTSLSSAVRMCGEMILLDCGKNLYGDFDTVTKAIDDLKNELLSKVTVATATNRKRR